MVVGEFTQEADVVVIGGGPGGYSAAFRAAELGQSVVIVDPRETLGGVCLYDGCVPSKTLLYMAEIIQTTRMMRHHGVTYTKPKINSAEVRGWISETIRKLAMGLESQAKKLGVEHIRGRAEFEDSRNIAVRDSDVPRIRFKRAIIATGSCEVAHPNIPHDNHFVMSPEKALHVNEIPKSLLIVGSTYMAAELATLYAAFGSKVTIVFEGDRLLPDLDSDLVQTMTRTLGKSVKTIHANTSIAGTKEHDGGLAVQLKDKKGQKDVEVERVIVAIGQCANLEGLNIGKTNAQLTPEGFVQVDDEMRTTDPRIFAVGDVTGSPLLADKALHQGRVSAEVIAGKKSAFDPTVIPLCIFTDPQIAWCGQSEDEAKANGMNVKSAKIPWGFSGRAMGMGRHDGVTKIVYDSGSKLIVGVGMVGPIACELIAEGALAIEMGATLDDLAGTIHPHPTLSELASDAARYADVD